MLQIVFGPGNGSQTLTHLVVLLLVVVLVVLGLFEKSLRLLHFLFKFLQISSHNPISLTHPLTVFDFAISMTSVGVKMFGMPTPHLNTTNKEQWIDACMCRCQHENH